MLGEKKVASCSTCTKNSVNKRPTGEEYNNQCSRYLLLCTIFAFSHPTRQIKLTFFYNFAFCFFLRVVNFIYLSILVMFMVLSFTFQFISLQFNTKQKERKISSREKKPLQFKLYYMLGYKHKTHVFVNGNSNCSEHCTVKMRHCILTTCIPVH